MHLRNICRAFLLAVLVSCDSATAPIEPPVIEQPDTSFPLCTGVCAGLDLEIDSMRVVLPGNRTTVFSGDTIAVVISITNRGTEASDSSVQIRLQSFSNAYGILSLAPLRAGATRVVTVSVFYPMFSRSARTQDSMFVEVARFGGGVPFNYQFHDEKVTARYPFAGTTMRMQGTPAMLRFPSSDYEVSITINNPSPRTIPGDSLSSCVFDIDYCFLNNIKSGYIPTVGPGQSVTVPFRLNIGMNVNQWTPDEIRGPWDLVVCHGRWNESRYCASEKTTIVPDFEKFCPTLPILQPGNVLTIENLGRCGKGPVSAVPPIGLEMVAFDVVAGKTYQLQVIGTGSTPGVEFRKADTEMISNGGQGGGMYIVRPNFTGRIYVSLLRSASFTLQLTETA